MKSKPYKVYILSQDGYMEISYVELCNMRESDKTYSDNHFFIPLQGVLMEVSKIDYHEFYQDHERIQYLKTLDKQNGLLSIDAFDNEDDNGTDYVVDYNMDVEETTINLMMVEKVREYILKLSADEKELIHAIYYNNMSERQYSVQSGIPQKTINDRKHRILVKLKIFLEI